jgi:hypothetical protein
MTIEPSSLPPSPLLLPSESPPPALLVGVEVGVEVGIEVGVEVIGPSVGDGVGPRVSHSRSEVVVGAARWNKPWPWSHVAVNCTQAFSAAS